MIYNVEGNPQLDSRDWSMYSNILKVVDNSLIIHKSAYHLFSLLISKRGFSSLQTRETFGKILRGNYRFLIPVIILTPCNCTYLLHRASHFYATYALSKLTIGLFYCCPLGLIRSELINTPAIKREIVDAFKKRPEKNFATRDHLNQRIELRHFFSV